MGLATGGERASLADARLTMQLKRLTGNAGGTGAWMVNGFDKACRARLAQGADLVAFGRPFIANPGPVERLKVNGPYNLGDQSTPLRRYGKGLHRSPHAETGLSHKPRSLRGSTSLNPR
jgi:2,4-dienoyl-CoA reductase-like NADH-dependent reductase (Old Yellow Enzyme family)